MALRIISAALRVGVLALGAMSTVVGCASDVRDRGERGSGGAGSGDDATGSSTVAPVGSGGADGGGGAPATGSTSTGLKSTSTGPDCGADADVFTDPALAECAADSCCEELTACLDEPEDCLDPESGALDPSLPLGEALRDCTVSAGCVSGGCMAGIGFGEDPDQGTIDFANCINDECCEELTFCTNNAEDGEACIACLEAGPPYGELCAPADACAQEECGRSFAAGAVCDSGFAADGSDQATRALGECLGDNCCEEFSACTDGGADAQRCFDCFAAGEPYGADCVEADACWAANCGSGFGIELCDSGLGVGDLDAYGCSETYCCDAYNACTNFAENEASVQSCLDCLNAEGGPVCDAIIACEATNCDTAVCDSGIAYSDIDMARCLEDNCCAEYTSCAGGDPDDEEAVQECIDCFIEEEHGPLCDAAIACTNNVCDGDIE